MIRRLLFASALIISGILIGGAVDILMRPTTIVRAEFIVVKPAPTQPRPAPDVHV